jgi:hypothetical protein
LAWHIARASLILNLGTLMLPHGLARIVLTEQLYRATTILAGHPYHRGVSGGQHKRTDRAKLGTATFSPA